MKQLHLKIYLFIFFVGIFFASSAQALTITPARQTVIIDPGSSQTIRLTVENNEKEVMEVTGVAEGFRIEEKTHRATFGVKDDAAEWVKVSPSVVALAPGETKDILFTFTVPKNAESKVHYIALFAEVKAGKGQVGISSRLGSLLFFYVSGNIIEEMDVLDFSAGSEWYLKNKVQLFARGENNGTIHVIPEGKVTIKDWWSNIITEIPINPENRLVIPQSQWSEPYDVALGPSHIGKIHATLKFKYGINQKTILKKIDFWYIPVWFIAALGILSVIIFSGTIALGMRLGTKNK